MNKPKRLILMLCLITLSMLIKETQYLTYYFGDPNAIQKLVNAAVEAGFTEVKNGIDKQFWFMLKDAKFDKYSFNIKSDVIQYKVNYTSTESIHVFEVNLNKTTWQIQFMGNRTYKTTVIATTDPVIQTTVKKNDSIFTNTTIKPFDVGKSSNATTQESIEPKSTPGNDSSTISEKNSPTINNISTTTQSNSAPKYKSNSSQTDTTSHNATILQSNSASQANSHSSKNNSIVQSNQTNLQQGNQSQKNSLNGQESAPDKSTITLINANSSQTTSVSQANSTSQSHANSALKSNSASQNTSSSYSSQAIPSPSNNQTLTILNNAQKKSQSIIKTDQNQTPQIVKTHGIDKSLNVTGNLENIQSIPSVNKDNYSKNNEVNSNITQLKIENNTQNNHQSYTKTNLRTQSQHQEKNITLEISDSLTSLNLQTKQPIAKTQNSITQNAKTVVDKTILQNQTKNQGEAIIF